jgi:hypothetical protein
MAAPDALDKAQKEQIDKNLARIVRQSRRVIWAILVLMAVVLMVVAVTAAVLAVRQVGEQARIANTISRNTEGLCSFFYHTAVSVPPYDVLAQSAATVQFRLDARQAVAQLGCRQHLPAPPARLVLAAAKYHLGVPY